MRIELKSVCESCKHRTSCMVKKKYRVIYCPRYKQKDEGVPTWTV